MQQWPNQSSRLFDLCLSENTESLRYKSHQVVGTMREGCVVERA